MNNWKKIRALYTVAALLLGLATTPTAAEVAKKIYKRQDGSTIYWSLEHPSGSEPRGLLLIAQGSGCLPAIQNPTVAQARSIAPDFSILLVEKYGVTHGDKPKDQMNDCPEKYFAHHTVTQRADDVVQVVGELKEADWWNGKLVLFGGSEGGAVVARLTPRLQPDAAVVFSSGLGESLAESLPRVMPPDAAKMADAKFAEARANPDSSEIWGGNSYRWWADIVDDVLVNHLLKTKVPVLLVNGERDSVQSARAAHDVYKAANRCELTYWEFPDYDHFMTDSDGKNHREEVFAKISEWIDSALSGGKTDCPETNTGV